MKSFYICTGIIIVSLLIGQYPSKSMSEESMKSNSILKDRKICVDPGHGGTAGKDMFRQGPAGEREEWINLRVGLILKDLLENAGATVILTRTEDKFVELKDRADMAIQNKCDLFVSIHHNGTEQDNKVNNPLVFYFKNASENQASIEFAKILAEKIRKALGFKRADLFSDWTIYPNSGTAVLRITYLYMPGVIGEASYFTNPEEEKKLKDKAYNQKEAQAYFDAITEYFSMPMHAKNTVDPNRAPLEIYARTSVNISISSTAKVQKNEAKEEYEKGGEIVEEMTEDTTQKVFTAEQKEKLLSGIQLLIHGLGLFPDSNYAGNSQYRIGVGYEKLADDPIYKEKAIQAYTRLIEYYPTCDDVPMAKKALARLTGH